MSRPPLPAGPRVVPVVGAAIIRGSTCLIAQRGPGGSSGGLWEFPGGKVEPGESPEEALFRELQEELGIAIDVQEWLGRGEARPSERHIVLDVYRAAIGEEDTPIAGPAHEQCRWVGADGLSCFAWATADVPLLPIIQRLLKDPA